MCHADILITVYGKPAPLVCLVNEETIKVQTGKNLWGLFVLFRVLPVWLYSTEGFLKEGL